jgi:hypothetical protein
MPLSATKKKSFTTLNSGYVNDVICHSHGRYKSYLSDLLQEGPVTVNNKYDYCCIEIKIIVLVLTAIYNQNDFSNFCQFLRSSSVFTKMFSSKLINRPNKLECLSVACISSLV